MLTGVVAASIGVAVRFWLLDVFQSVLFSGGDWHHSLVGEADLTEALVGRNLLTKEVCVAPAQALAPEVAAFGAGVFPP